MVLNRPAELERRLPQALAILRVVTGLFFLLWALEKLVMPEVNAAIWESFYGIPLDVNLSYPIGILNTVLSLALIAGFKRRFTYAYWTLVHFISVASTWDYLIKPFGGPNHLFLAGVPILAIMVTLYGLRDWDTMTVDGRRAAPAA